MSEPTDDKIAKPTEQKPILEQSESAKPIDERPAPAATTKEHVYKFDVKMTCAGCSGAVKRALERKPGIISHKVDLGEQEVIVCTSLEYEDVLETIKKTGKEVRKGEVVVDA